MIVFKQRLDIRLRFFARRIVTVQIGFYRFALFEEFIRKRIGIRSVNVTHFFVYDFSRAFCNAVPRCQIRSAPFGRNKRLPCGLFHTVKTFGIFKLSAFHLPFRVVFAEPVKLHTRAVKHSRRSDSHGQHSVPSVTVFVHLLPGYGIIGQNVHLHGGDFIALVDKSFLFFRFVEQCDFQAGIHKGLRKFLKERLVYRKRFYFLFARLEIRRRQA